jgi:hypothetical protein
MDAGERDIASRRHDSGEEHDPEREQGEDEEEEEENDNLKRIRGLPSDLPRSLEDRRSYTYPPQETEYYDAWQGVS